jgi:hypothetical protein
MVGRYHPRHLLDELHPILEWVSVDSSGTDKESKTWKEMKKQHSPWQYRPRHHLLGLLLHVVLRRKCFCRRYCSNLNLVRCNKRGVSRTPVVRERIVTLWVAVVADSVGGGGGQVGWNFCRCHAAPWVGFAEQMWNRKLDSCVIWVY